MQFSSLVRSFSKSGDFSWSLLTNNNGAVQDTKSSWFAYDYCRSSVLEPQVVEIQGLRGVAIIGVLLFHLWGKTTFKEGYLGVDIFFVISGYLMCLLLTRETQLTVGRVTDFYYRRAKRIVPIYLLVIWLVLIAAVFHFIYPIDYLPFISESLKPLLFIANVPDSTADDYFIQVNEK
ncbi:hypothetical protein M3Y94_00039100 [Aphelenchoides besseyi]|nr:hypothetical protein M3Y94_00039100 [Aphelenchoides besseyi]